jgi:hypothetical protein
MSVDSSFSFVSVVYVLFMFCEGFVLVSLVWTRLKALAGIKGSNPARGMDV